MTWMISSLNLVNRKIETDEIGMRKDNIEAIYPLSSTQEGILFHTLYSPKTGLYFEQFTSELAGELDITAFESSWRQVVARHSALRTLFTWEKRSKPLQIVREKVELAWEHLDWREFSAEVQRERLAALLETDKERGFKLDQAPLMRFALIQLEQHSYQFVWSFHHLLLDGWSMRLVLKEVFAIYEALCSAQVPELKYPRPYKDYITWLQQQDLSKAEFFFTQELKGFTEPTCLPVERDMGNREEGYRQEQIALSEATTTALQRIARTHNLTLNTVVEGAWALLLNRYSCEEDIVFGATVTCRPASLNGIEDAVGLFINTLPVRVQVKSNDLMLPWLQALQAKQVEMREYEYSPLVQINKWSEVPSGQPLFESIIVFENHPLDVALIEEASLKLRNAQYLERSNYPLAVVVVPEEQLQLIIIYDNTRFERVTISRMLGHLRTLLEGMASNLDREISALPLLTEEERNLILVDWNETKEEYPNHLCIHQVIEQQMEKEPNAKAVVFGGEELTYRELNSRANRLAHLLQSLGVCPDICVGLCVERTIEMIVGILAILKAGGAYVPIDPTYPQDRLAFMLENTQASVLLTTKEIVDKHVISIDSNPCKIAYLDTDSEQIAANPETNPESQVAPQNLAYVIYTSGSTGKPKGVEISHQNLVHSTYARMHYYPKPVNRFLLLSSFAFDSSVAGIFWTLCQGGTLILPPQRIEQDMSQLGDLIAQRGISHMLCLPSLYNLLLEHVDTSHLQSLQSVIVAGEACPMEVVQRHYSFIPECKFYNEYGPTEGTVWSTVYEALATEFGSHVPIGRPIANMQVFLLDTNGQPVPVGVPGELYIGGAGLARGYCNRHELTDEFFLHSSINDLTNVRLYKTGDMARYLPDGNIVFLGRKDHQVKIRGYRVELEEIEGALKQYPGVHEAVVVARDDNGRANHEEEKVLAEQLSALDKKIANELLMNIEELSEEAAEMLLAHGT